MPTPIRPISVPLRVDRFGIIRVAGTRVTLDTVLAAFNRGSTPEEIFQQYPPLDLADIYASITYYLYNHAEIDNYPQQRSKTRARVREVGKTLFSTSDVRQQLLRRRKNL